ncbi:MAG: methylenetetrahydrofolate--tRNA-(uracil(54)-C(5))-methyltransferase (FADH(2)-oxidizing) TrmFO, partial [Clostridia bacterium]
EGYVESASSGLVAALSLARTLQGKAPIFFPRTTAIGALAQYVSTPNRDFQPMNANFGLIDPLQERVRDKMERYERIAARALDTLTGCAGDI